MYGQMEPRPRLLYINVPYWSVICHTVSMNRQLYEGNIHVNLLCCLTCNIRPRLNGAPSLKYVQGQFTGLSNIKRLSLSVFVSHWLHWKALLRPWNRFHDQNLNEVWLLSLQYEVIAMTIWGVWSYWRLIERSLEVWALGSCMKENCSQSTDLWNLWSVWSRRPSSSGEDYISSRRLIFSNYWYYQNIMWPPQHYQLCL